MNKTAIFPGSFSPFTLGHKSVVDRALPLFDKIIIAIGINSEKDEYFSIEERENWINSIYKNNPKIETEKYEGLTVDFCGRVNAKYIISSKGFFTGFLNLTIDNAPIIPKDKAKLLEITLVITKVVIGNNKKVRK